MKPFALVLILTTFTGLAHSSTMEMGGDFLQTRQASTVQILGDLTLITLPLLSYALNLQKEPSNDGLKQNLKGQTASLALTVILKQACDQINLFGYQMGKRPDGQNYNFPSGHSALVFATSFHIYKRYHEYFWPFMSLSLFTAFSRVYAKKHDVPAVLGGALLGLATSAYFSTSFPKQTKAFAYFSPDKKSWQLGLTYSF